MKIIVLGVVIAAILIATVPAIRDSGGSASFPTSATASSPPAGGNEARSGFGTYRSLLGHHSGLSSASLTQGPAASMEVYTLETLFRAARQYQGQTVRLRLSRPISTAAQADDGQYMISFIDKDVGGHAAILFPAEIAEKLDLIHRQAPPGFTLYVAFEDTSLRAVGREWRADLKRYVW